MKDYDFCFKKNEEYFGKINDSEEKITKEEFQQWIRRTIINGFKDLKQKKDEIPL